MGKMNESTFQTLFEYGKKVYLGDMDLTTAAEKASVQNPEVLLNEYKYVQPTITPKDMAKTAKSKGIHLTDIFNILSPETAIKSYSG